MAETAAASVTHSNWGVFGWTLDMWETDTNTLVFESWDEYLNPDDDYGIYFGFNYSASSGTVTAASEVQDFHLYFAQLEGPASTLAGFAAQSGGRIV